MEYIVYLFRFLYRIKWWLIIVPLLVGVTVYYTTKDMKGSYEVSTTVYTGVVSGYNIENSGIASNLNASNSEMDNLINVMTAESTLKKVSFRLFARNMVYGSPDNDTKYLTAESYREIYGRMMGNHDAKRLQKLIDKSSEDKTMQNIVKYEQPDKANFIYGLFYYFHPQYSYSALKNIKISRKGSSDLLEISYSSSDPGIAFNTVDILLKEFITEYQKLRFGETDSVINFFRSELNRIGNDLRLAEDSLTDYNIEKRVINYTDETKEIAAIDKEFELREQDVLFSYNSSKALIDELERRMGSNAQSIRNNLRFVEKLKEASTLTGKMSQIENSGTNTDNLQSYQNRLDKTTKDLESITDKYVTQQYTKEGIAKKSVVDQWLEQILLFEKAKSDLEVIQTARRSLDEKYRFFAPVGSTLKRKERLINFNEQNYMTLLNNYNDALTRRKNLQMSSASLKVLNPPSYPLTSSSTPRKKIVYLSVFGSVLFIIGFFLLIEILDRTLRDKIRAERIIGGKVLGAYPNAKAIRYKKYEKAIRLISSRYLSTTVLSHFNRRKPGYPYIVNVISTEEGDGKSYLINELEEYWQLLGIKTRKAVWNKDFNINSPEFVLAQTITDFCYLNGEDILIMEYPNMGQHNISEALLQEANLNLMVVRATRAWKPSDKLVYEKVKAQSGNTPLCFYLNFAEQKVVEGFTGMLPPYNKMNKLIYRFSHLGLTEKL